MLGARTRRDRFARIFLLLGLAASTRCATCGTPLAHPEAIKHHDTAIAYLKQGQCVPAEERCRLALEYGESFEHPHNCLGLVALQCHGDLDEASRHFKTALSVNPDFAEAHNNLGVCFFRKTPPDYDLACEEFKAALEIDPGYFDARENYGMCLMRRGTVAGDAGNADERKNLYAEARSHMIRLLEMSPNNFNARHHLGLMDLFEKRYEGAEEHFKRCLEIDPENPVCSYNLGNTYLETARCTEAIQAYVGALRSEKDSEIAIGSRANLAVAYEQCAKKDAAIKAFLDRIKLDPGNPTHHYDLGKIYADKGMPDHAINEWENTVKLDPLYCPAHYELAMQANKVLDTKNTLTRCRDFVHCANEGGRGGTPARWADAIEQCKELVKRLEME